MVVKPRSKIPRPVKAVSKRKYVNTATSGPKNPLLPVSLNNNATVAKTSESFRMVGTEYSGQPITLRGREEPGEIIYNKLITPAICPRLQAQSKCWQRYKINKIGGQLVTLNGSTVQSGYTMAYIDDPSYPIRLDSKGITNLTAFRGSTVRQNWVMSSVSNTTKNGERPPLFVAERGDVRLYSPGRVVVQLNGQPASGDNDFSTWALMINYDITFYSPGVDSTDDVEEDFDAIWETNQTIALSPLGPGLASSASTTGLEANRRYYVRSPVPVAVVVDGANGITWCVGFSTSSTPSTWSSNLPITNQNPSDRDGDKYGATPVASLGLNVFFQGVGFTDIRPVYTVPDISKRERFFVEPEQPEDLGQPERDE